MAKTMPPLAVESSLVRTIPVSPTASWKALAWARPFWPVVASSTKSVSGSRAGQALVDDPADLGQLVHEVRLRVQASGGVGDDEVGAAGDRRVEGIEHDRPGIRAWRVGDDRDAGAIRPDPELVDGRGAERVRRGEDDRPALAEVARGELADRRRLARAVDADDEDDRRPAGRRGRGVPVEVALDEQGGEFGADRRLRAAGLAATPGALDEVDGEGGTDVAGDEDLLDVVPARIVAEEAAELGDQPGPGPSTRRRRACAPGRRPGRRSGRTARTPARARVSAQVPRARARARAPVQVRARGSGSARRLRFRREAGSGSGSRRGRRRDLRRGDARASARARASGSGSSLGRRRQNGISRPGPARRGGRRPAPGPHRVAG